MTVQTSTLVGSGMYPRVDGHGSRATLVGALPSLLHVVAQQADMAATASAIAERLVATLDAVTSAVYLVDRAAPRTLRLAASQNLATTAEIDVLDIDVSSLPAATAARTRTLVMAASRSQPVVRAVERIALAHCGPAVVFGFPLLVGDRLLGAVSAELSGRIEPWELESLGVVLSAIMDRARLAEELHDRDEWTRVVAHEVRQPLNAMSLHGRWLSREMPDGPCSCSIRQVLDGVKRVNRLVGDLLDTSLNDISNVELSPRPTDVVSLARDLASPCDLDGATRVRVEAAADVPELEIDPERIEQVLANLLVNAVKYGRPTSEIRLDIAASARARSISSRARVTR